MEMKTNKIALVRDLNRRVGDSRSDTGLNAMVEYFILKIFLGIR